MIEPKSKSTKTNIDIDIECMRTWKDKDTVIGMKDNVKEKRETNINFSFKGKIGEEAAWS